MVFGVVWSGGGDDDCWQCLINLIRRHFVLA